ncbi:hypothetical protein [Streptomyces mirabilis]|uniref:hypothetical protein n=1 Tax=Streptomyces mirabilis TaxID=68239 RepID=UPI003318DE58
MGKRGDLFTVHRRSLARTPAARTSFFPDRTERTERIGRIGRIIQIERIEQIAAASTQEKTAATDEVDPAAVRP